MPLDDAFVEELKRGLPAAYARLVDCFESSLYRFFLCDHRSHHLAEDQTAETFAELVRALPTLRGGQAQLRAFVFATARHVQLRRWRRPRNRTVALDEVVDECDRNPSPAATAEAREDVDIVLKAVSELDDPLPSVLVLRFVEGFSIDEVAAALAMPVGTVKSHIHRGRLRLKEIFAEQKCEHDER
jgi:RNA polymerase sigma-70 factor (ECF subfamily)